MALTMTAAETKRTRGSTVFFSVTLLLVLGGLGYMTYLWYTEHQSNVGTSAALEAKTAELAAADERIAELESTLGDIRADLAELEDDYQDEKEKNDEFEDQINAITGTVNDLDKLSKTDEELLQKYSKVSFLNENYIPSDLDEIDDEYVQDDREPEFFHADAMDFLEELLDDAADDDIDITIVSAYRSFDEQDQLKGQFTQVYGEGANAFSADQGFSEHQLGTTVDFGTSQITSAQAVFAQTEAYEWLLQNAHKYGFTLSYPENNGYYIFEPWHWRFVGEDLAEDLDDADAHFYDWDQRRIDEYLIKIFD